MSTIFDDIRAGTLTQAKLNSHLKTNPGIVNDHLAGMTPLCLAVLEGKPQQVKLLLTNGAMPDVPSLSGETPLLLAAWKTVVERPLIIQLLLKNMPPGSIDRSTNGAMGNTPLMFAIQKGDADSVRNLRRAGASLEVVNLEGVNAEKMASNSNIYVQHALHPDQEPYRLASIADALISVLLYILGWFDKVLLGRLREASGFNPPEFDYAPVDTNEDGDPNPTTEAWFEENVNAYIQEQEVLGHFFGNRPEFVKDLAKKLGDLKEDPDSFLADGNEEIESMAVKISLFQQVFYCDDSSSMSRGNRWESQRQLISRIARITTRILPDGEGVVLRFINRIMDSSIDLLTLDALEVTLRSLSWMAGGRTPIGTSLRSKILQPLVYDKIASGTLDRPLLITIVTDGNPTEEPVDTLAKAIKECEGKLTAASLPRETVRFLIGQIGRSTRATEFLESLKNKPEIASMVYVTTERLDEKFAGFRENSRDMDRWLIELLIKPLMDPIQAVVG